MHELQSTVKKMVGKTIELDASPPPMTSPKAAPAAPAAAATDSSKLKLKRR